MKRTKKGFTIVELTIVIVIVAVLVSIFISIVEKANASADIQLIRQVNTILKEEEVFDTVDWTDKADVERVLEENGIPKADLHNPKSKNHEFEYKQNYKCYIVWQKIPRKLIFPEGLYAAYTVEYNANGGEGTTLSSNHIENEAKKLAANGFTRTGYTFAGWNTQADGNGTSYSDQESVINLSTTDGATVRLHAQWTENTYAIKYDGNGADSGSVSEQSLRYTQSSSIAQNGFERSGWNFTGWNTATDGTGTTYIVGQSVSQLTSENNGIVTLYAQWKEVPRYTISLKTADNDNASYAIFYVKNGAAYSDRECTAPVTNISQLSADIQAKFKPAAGEDKHFVGLYQGETEVVDKDGTIKYSQFAANTTLTDLRFEYNVHSIIINNVYDENGNDIAEENYIKVYIKNNLCYTDESCTTDYHWTAPTAKRKYFNGYGDYGYVYPFGTTEEGKTQYEWQDNFVDGRIEKANWMSTAKVTVKEPGGDKDYYVYGFYWYDSEMCDHQITKFNVPTVGSNKTRFVGYVKSGPDYGGADSSKIRNNTIIKANGALKPIYGYGEVTLEPLYRPVLTLTLDANGGTAAQNTTIYAVGNLLYEDAGCTKLITDFSGYIPSKAGYTFVGYYIKKNNNYPTITAEGTVASEEYTTYVKNISGISEISTIVLYAKWKKN